MPALAEATLTDVERRVLDRFVAAMRARVSLRSVWLYGSRARGERTGPYSDVDIVVITEGGAAADGEAVHDLLHRAINREPGAHARFMVSVESPDWAPGRRAIGDFLIREIDRDRVVLYGGEDDARGSDKAYESASAAAATEHGMKRRSEEFLEAAHESLRSARLLLEAGHFTGSIHPSYYAMFYAARAALSEEDAYARTHDGTWHLFRKTFVEGDRFPASLYELGHGVQKPREDADYRAPVLDRAQAVKAVDTAERFLSTVERMLDH